MSGRKESIGYIFRERYRMQMIMWCISDSVGYVAHLASYLRDLWEHFFHGNLLSHFQVTGDVQRRGHPVEFREVSLNKGPVVPPHELHVSLRRAAQEYPRHHAFVKKFLRQCGQRKSMKGRVYGEVFRVPIQCRTMRKICEQTCCPVSEA